MADFSATTGEVKKGVVRVLSMDRGLPVSRPGNRLTSVAIKSQVWFTSRPPSKSRYARRRRILEASQVLHLPGRMSKLTLMAEHDRPNATQALS